MYDHYRTKGEHFSLFNIIKVKLGFAVCFPTHFNREREWSAPDSATVNCTLQTHVMRSRHTSICYCTLVESLRI